MSEEFRVFAELFSGSKSAYGIHIPEKVKEGEKAKGKSFTKKENLPTDFYEKHLKGEISLGIVPIVDDELKFMALDVDVYNLDQKPFCSFFEKWKLPFVCFRSKSGGVHMYCFFDGSTNVSRALDCAKLIKYLVGLSETTEIFPKQKVLQENQKGNWINLPYFGGEKSERYAYDGNGKRLGFYEAMTYCSEKRTSLRQLETLLEKLPFSQAAPCLQAIFMRGEASVKSRNRNVFLFNSAVYLKARFKDEYDQKLVIVNSELDTPLDETELSQTIIASHNKHQYSYQCEDPCLQTYCNSSLCKSRPFGKGCSTIGDLSFEQLTQVMTNPPYYKWLVNGVEMVFFTESDLIHQGRFIAYCIRHLHKMPNKLKDSLWNEIINKALLDVNVEYLGPSEDLSESSMWFSHLQEFLFERKIAERPSQIEMGQVFLLDGAYYFRPESFVSFLTDVKNFRVFTPRETHYALKHIGTKLTKVYDPSLRRSIRAWAITAEDISKVGSPEMIETEEPSKKPKIESAEDSIEKLRRLVEPIKIEEEPLDFSDLKEKDKF